MRKESERLYVCDMCGVAVPATHESCPECYAHKLAAKDAEIARLKFELSKRIEEVASVRAICDELVGEGDRLKERANEYANALTYIENAVPNGIQLVARALTAARDK